MNLLWEQRQRLGALSEDVLSAAFALSLLFDTFDETGKHCRDSDRGWSRCILHDRPEIAEHVCTILSAERLSHRKDMAGLLHRVPEAAAAPWRCKVATRLLDEFEINASDLRQLFLMAAESDDGLQRLAMIVSRRASVASCNGSAEDRFWIVAGYVLFVQQFEAKLTEAAVTHPETLWVIRSLTSPSTQKQGSSGPFNLSLQQMEFIVRTFGSVFQNTTHPTAGWGDQSDFDAAMYLADLITAISNRPDIAARECLERILRCEGLVSYHPWVRSRLAAQRELRRQSRYEKPTWKAVCAVLRGGEPANMEDLKALFLNNLIDAAGEIRQSNLDRYRVYWTGGRSRLGTPQDEEFCRDRLVEYIRERLNPMHLWVEPEGHMAADKRADIVIYGPHALKLPIEVKRDTNKDLWVAAKSQLERLYARDPNASGYGVYLVFYFGAGRGCNITPHPEKAPLTDSPKELENALNATVPPEHRDKITCVVIDVSPPALPRSLKSKTNDFDANREQPATTHQQSPQKRKKGKVK